MRTGVRLSLMLLALSLVLSLTGGPARAEVPTVDEPGTYLVEVATGRTIRLGRGALVAWSPDSQLVAVADNGGESPMPHPRLVQISDGEGREVMLSEQGEINHLRWSPDGSRVAFTLTRNGPDPGPALLVVDRDSAAVRQLARGSIGELAWTPDSQGITAITLDEGGGSIVTFEAATGEIRETVPDARDASCQRGLAWSPDGAYLAYGGPGLREGCGDAGNWGVWIWEPATQTIRQLFQGAADAPQWLDNGELVAMVSEPREEDIPPLSIVRLAPNGEAPRPIAQNVPRMSPQPPRLVQVVGSTVLFPISTCDQGEAYLWSPGQGNTIRRTPPGVFAYRPTLAPDGRSLAYVRIGDRVELVLAPFDGEARVLATTSAGLQVGTAGPFDAGGDWSPDGQWIAVEVTVEQFRDCID